VQSAYFVPGILRVPHVPSAHAGTLKDVPTATSGDLTSHSAGEITATHSYAEYRLLAGSYNTSAINTHNIWGESV
jgi:hypothetical protein